MGNAIAAMRGWAANTQQESYFGGNYSHANLVVGNGTEGFDNGGIYHDVDLWLQGVPAGTPTLFRRRILLNLGYNFGFVPPGLYMVATRQGMICTVENGQSSTFMHITQQGIDSPTQSLRNATFTIDDLGPDGNYGTLTLNAYVQAPASGGPFDCKDLYVGLVSDYAAWLAGQTNSAAFQAKYAGVAAIKSADWLGLNTPTALTYTTRADQLVSTTRSYQGTANRSYGVMAKQCKDLGCINWVCLPYVFENYLFSCTAATNTIHRTQIPGATMTPRAVGDCIALTGSHYQDGVPKGGLQGALLYYIVEIVDADTFRISTTPGGTPVTITADYSGVGDYSASFVLVLDPYPLWVAIFQQIKAANPSGIILPQLALEPWNSYYPTYELLRQVSSLQAGFPFNQGKGYGYRLMRMWKAAEAVFPRSQIIRSAEMWGLGTGGYNTLGDAFNYVSTDPGFNFGKSVRDLRDCVATNGYPHFGSDSTGNEFSMLINYGTNPTPAQWSAESRLAIDYYAAKATEWRTNDPTVPVIMYETGLGEGMFYTGFSGANQAVTAVNTGSPGSLTTAPFNGGSPWPANLPVAITSTGTVPVIGTGGAYKYVHSSSTSTNLVLSDTRGGPPVAITTAGSGTITANGGTGQQILDLFASYAAYLKTQQYADDLKYFLDNVIIGAGFKARACAFYSVYGGQTLATNSFSFWGSGRDASLPDTLATTLMKTYGNYAANA